MRNLCTNIYLFFIYICFLNCMMLQWFLKYGDQDGARNAVLKFLIWLFLSWIHGWFCQVLHSDFGETLIRIMCEWKTAQTYIVNLGVVFYRSSFISEFVGLICWMVTIFSIFDGKTVETSNFEVFLGQMPSELGVIEVLYLKYVLSYLL